MPDTGLCVPEASVIIMSFPPGLVMAVRRDESHTFSPPNEMNSSGPSRSRISTARWLPPIGWNGLAEYVQVFPMSFDPGIRSLGLDITYAWPVVLLCASGSQVQARG